MSLGTNIRKFRKLMGISAQALADKLGCSAQAILQYERDERIPNITVLNKICYELQVSIDILTSTNLDFNLLNPPFSRKSDLLDTDLKNNIPKNGLNLKCSETKKDILLNFIESVNTEFSLNDLDDAFFDKLFEDVCELIEFKLYKHSKCNKNSYTK